MEILSLTLLQYSVLIGGWLFIFGGYILAKNGCECRTIKINGI